MKASASAPGLTCSPSPMAIHADLEHISFDRGLTAKIMKKRQEEMSRRNRLLDPRKRQYGVAHSVLDSQILEKRAAQAAEADEEDYYAKTCLLQEEVAQACEKMKDSAARDRKKASIAYSLEHLRKENRREYHLSDPSELKKDRVLTEEEMRAFGPSSMMLGERPEDALAKHKEKQRQMRSWLHDQMSEKESRRAAEREVDRMLDQEAAFANSVRAFCEKQARDEAREDKRAEVAENLEIAEQHAQRRQARVNRNIMMNDNHVNSILRDERLQEKHDYLVGSNGKLQKGEFRRISEAEKQDVFNTNAIQVLRKKQEKLAEKREDMEHAADITRGVEVLHAIELEKKRMVTERRFRAEEHNKKLATSKSELDLKERRSYLQFNPSY